MNRSPVSFINDPDEAYVMMRYRQIHDFWHVLTNLPPNLLGEITLKVYEFEVTGLPSCFIGGSVGQLRLSSHERAKLWKEYIPWALRSAKQSHTQNKRKDESMVYDLMTYPYEDNLDKDITLVREELNIEPFKVYV